MIISQNKKFFLLTILISISLYFTVTASDMEKIQLLDDNYYINELKLQDYDGKYFYIKDKKAKFYIINIWASWCAPCIKEMKSLNNLKKKKPSTLVITISQDNNVEEAKKFFLKHKYNNLEKYFDYKKEFIEKIKIRGIPTTFIADERYKIIAKVEGTIAWDSDEFIKWLSQNYKSSS